MLDIALLGTGGMMPLANRYLTSLLCRLNGSLFLVDCGEGTQMTARLLGWGFKRIDYIFFTHFHGDHITGLPGILYTMAHAGRDEPLHIYGPEGLTKVVDCLCVVARDLPYEVVCHEMNGYVENEPIGEFYMSALPLQHRTACYGYAFTVPRQGRFDPVRAEALALPKKYWSLLQKGETVDFDGLSFTPDMVLGPPRKGIKVAYCTDTRPTRQLPDFVRGADLFICEGLYGDDEMRDKAASHKHMVYSEAAAIARAGQVKELWLTHFSPAMTNPKEHLSFATDIFPGASAGYDRRSATIDFDEDNEIID